MNRQPAETAALAHREAVIATLDYLAEQVLQGKIRALRLAWVCLLAGGHLLLEDIPGLGKTTLALALSRVLGLQFGRVQCTADLLPSDITGLSIFDRQENRFRFVRGPIFSHLLLVDEINRAMPKTQSALLEAMEEHRVTVEGTTYPLSAPFMVIATQNPVEQAGTFPLPESQLDRFLAATSIGYPPAERETDIIRHGSVREELEEIEPRLDRETLLAARAAVRTVHLGDKVAGYIQALAAATREHPYLLTGLSTRAAISLAAAARARAYLEGRDYVAPEDVRDLLVPVGAHRLILRPDRSGEDKKEVLLSIADATPLPLA
ncbi:MAG: MoxR family ATPase [Geothermobacteraceae bacterium]